MPRSRFTQPEIIELIDMLLAPYGYFQIPRIFNRSWDFWISPPCWGCVSPLGVNQKNHASYIFVR